MAYNVNQNWNNQIGDNMFGFGNPPNQGIASVKVPQDAQRYFSGDAEIFQPGANWQNELAGYGSTMNRGNIDNTWSSNIKDNIGNFKDTLGGLKNKIGSFGKGIMDNTIVGKIAAMNDATNPRAWNYNPNLRGQIDYMQDQGMYGKDASTGLNKITRGVLKDKNLQSIFGTNDLGQMLSKQLGKYEKTYGNLEKQWGNTLNEKELELKKQRYFKKFIEPARIEQENQIAAAKKEADARIAVERQRAATAPQRREGRGGTHMSRGRDQGGLGISSAQAQQVSDANRAAGMSGWGLAQGGRAGYQNGELVEQETDLIEGPQGGEEFQETVVEGQEQPSREQLEALAIEIFQLPLEELDDEQLLVVYQEAMQGQPMEEAVQEEDVQFAANGGLAGLL